MTSPISSSIFNNFNSYNDYLLSKNICLFLQKEYGIEQISKPSLLLLTKTVSNHIEELVYKIKITTELAEKEESNIIDVLFTFLLKNNMHKTDIIKYVNKRIKDEEEKKNQNYSIKTYIDIKKLNDNEEKQRINYLKELNCINVPQSNCINKTLLNSIPKHLRYFPREFTLKHSDNILNKTEETIKEKNEIKKLEKKSLEQIISGHGYYEAEQKNQNKKGYINMLSLYNEIVKKLEHNLSSDDYSNTKKELFGQRFYMRSFEDEHKVNEEENKNIVDNEIHMNNNNDSYL
jgi:hypothetical protein